MIRRTWCETIYDNFTGGGGGVNIVASSNLFDTHGFCIFIIRNASQK